MPLLGAAELTVEADLIVLDKDGTLVDVNSPWAQLGVEWATRIAFDLEDRSARAELLDLLGVDAETMTVVGDGPMAVWTVQQVVSHMENHLHERTGSATRAAELLVPFPSVTLDETTVRPLGDVAATLERLSLHGFRFAIATSDDRASALRSLEILGIAEHVVAGHYGDDGEPKPSPTVLASIARQSGVEPARMVMVGDSRNDIAAGRAGGAAASIGVAVDGAARLRLEAVADAVVDSIEDLTCRS